MPHHTAIVFIEMLGQTIPAGRMKIIEDGHYTRSEFSYGKRYLERPDAVAIDPVYLPLSSAPMVSPADFPLFNGIRDASPDAFGRGLIDRWMCRVHNRPAGEAEFLLASQSGTRIGALRFGRTPDGPGQVLDHAIPAYDMPIGEMSDFQKMVDQHMDDGKLPERFLNLVAPGSDAGGARPKATVLIDGFPWLAKFSKESDRVCNASAEAACLDLCELAGLNVPERRIETIGGRDTLLLKRFDRDLAPDGSIRRRHMISSLTMLGAHESDTGQSGYADIYDAMRRHASGPDMGVEVFKRMVMNVLVGNGDDHYRNHAFLLGDDGKFRISPVFDIMPTLQASSSRRLFLHLGKAGVGRHATLEAAIEGGESLGLRRDQAEAIAMDLAQMVAANWEIALRKRAASAHDLEMLSNGFAEAVRAGRSALEDCEP